MTTFILIHGAWHGGWCWDELAPLLRKAGHTVIAPDLPGLGKDNTPLAEIDLSRWTLFVSDIVVDQLEDVVLVGHSRGGIVISEVAEIVPDRIKTLVYLTAFLNPDGKSMMDLITAAPPNPAAEGAIVMDATGLSSTVADEKIIPVFYNTTPPAMAARAKALLRPEPMMSFATPVHTTAARFGRVKRAYIECTKDNAIPIALQRSMQAALPCAPVVTLETDHSPFFSAPERLAEVLSGMAKMTEW